MVYKLNKIIGSEKTVKNEMVTLEFNGEYSVKVYPNSINEKSETLYFIARDNFSKYLFIICRSKEGDFLDFLGDEIKNLDSHEEVFVKRCPLTSENSRKLQKRFEFTNPILLGKQNSFGFGDRLGLANPAHIKSLAGSDFKPIIAQQSIRELTRTNRHPSEVMSAAVWAVFQEGYKEGFGSDADHLKTIEDIDLMISNGFTMFTFDPGDHVVNEAGSESIESLSQMAEEMKWEDLNDSFLNMLGRYQDKKYVFDNGLEFTPSKEETLRAVIKYGRAIAHIHKLYKHMIKNYDSRPFEVEISIDETDSVTSPFEHFFIVSELNRLEVKMVSLAPRFIGAFEKGIDYIGDLKLFKQEYIKHLAIAKHFNSYKLSLHSGSDKFSVYKIIGKLNGWYTHVKTAGTSYLEALKVIATKNISLFRKILDFSRAEYMKEKESYHVSADINMVKAESEYSDSELLELFSQNDARQVLHVTFGKVLTEKDNTGEYLFRNEFLKCIKENEELHYKFIYEHFRKHLSPFEVNSKN